jgi:hypothetical protein
MAGEGMAVAMRGRQGDRASGGRARGAVALALALAAVSSALGSDTGLSGAEGHPRSRLPLAVWAAPLGDARLDAAVRRAVEDWNALFVEALGREAFAWTPRREAAQVTVAVEAAVSANLMGETYVRTGDGGVIELPVRIVVYEPRARGQTSRETLLYGIVAHELGHALGLPHTRDPRSLMCCVPGSVDFQDPVARDAYVEARRRPEVASVRGQLIEQYQRFWRSGS